jgi:hypothetical protein
MSNLIIDKEKFEKDGYLLVPSVFSSDEINQFRALAYEQYEIDKNKNLTFSLPHLPTQAKYNRGDLLSKEKLHSILLDDRIVQIARTILGTNDIVYFGDSTYQIGTGIRGFHRDNIDRTDLTGPDWQGEYTLIRIGIYLQNHKEYSGGVKVKVGSHKNADGKAILVGNETGDVALWSLKTLHSGNAVRLKLFSEFSINHSKIERFVPNFFKKDQQLERISLFMTYAVKSSHLDRYINEYSLKREDTVANLKASLFSESALALAKQKNIAVLKLVPEQN